jgi:CBS domain containing-hemolysin-like protein
MERARRNDEGDSRLREKLGALISVGISVLSRMARRLGYPALASVPVSAAILHRLDTVSVGQPLEDVAQLLVTGRHSEVPVVDGDKPVGVVTRGDLAAAVKALGPHAPVSDLPRRAVLTVSPGDSVEDVLGRLRADPEAVAVLVDHGAPVGVVTFEHLLEYLGQPEPPDRGSAT